MISANPVTTYERWMQEEAIPIVRGHGVTDLHEIQLEPWPRMEGRGAFIQLQGMEGLSGMYTVEIPPAGALNTEKHIYDELMYVLQGRGTTEVWNRPNGPRKTFEWETGTLFAPPLNT